MAESIWTTTNRINQAIISRDRKHSVDKTNPKGFSGGVGVSRCCDGDGRKKRGRSVEK